MGCFLNSRANIRTAPIIQQPFDKQNNFFTQNAIGTSTTRSDFGANDQALKSIKNSNATVFYNSNELDLSFDQYKLLNESVVARMELFYQCQLIFLKIRIYNKLGVLETFTRSEASKKINSTIDFTTNKIAGRYKETANNLSNIEVNRQFPLFKQSYDIMEKTCKLLSSREKLIELVSHFISIKFFCVENFDYMYTPNFYIKCLNVAAGNFDKENSTARERKALLVSMAKNYCLKGVAEKQLPNLMEDLKFIKRGTDLDKNFIDILESSIEILKVGLKNMNNPERSTIIKQFASPIRFTVYKVENEFRLDQYESRFLEESSDEDLIAVINQLKKIPVDLA